MKCLPAQAKFAIRGTCRRLFRIGADPSVWQVISLNHVTRNSARMLRGMLTLAGKSVRSLRIVGNCLPSAYWNELLKCSNLNTLEIYGAKLTAAQLKKLLSSIAPVTRLGFDMGTFEPSEFREYLSVVREVGDVTIRTHKQGIGLIRDVVSTWAGQGYMPPRLAIADLNAYATDYVPGRLIDVHRLPGCASHRAVLKLYTRNMMPLDLHPVPPVVEFQVEEGGMVLEVAESLMSGDSEARICLSAISENTLSGKYYSDVHVACYWQNLFCMERPLDFRSASLVHLDLTKMKSLLPKHLVQIGEHCSGLKQLILDGCDRCLMSLDGIKAVALKCPLKGLSLMGVVNKTDSVPCTLDLWNTIASMQTLTHIAVEGCLLQPSMQTAMKQFSSVACDPSSVHRLSFIPTFSVETSPIGLSLQRLKNLVALELKCYDCCGYCKRLTDNHLEALSHLMTLVYLRAKDLPAIHYTKWMTKVFMNCPGLKYVYISNRHGNVMLPTDPALYGSLEQFHLESPDQQLNNACVDALIAAGKLTHLFLVLNSMNADNVLKLARDLVHLVCCHVNIMQQVRNVRSLSAALKVLSKKQAHCSIDFKHSLYRYPKRTYLSAIASSELVPLLRNNE